MGYNEADTRAKLIDPALHSRGWTEEHIKHEVSAGPRSMSVFPTTEELQKRYEEGMGFKLSDPKAKPLLTQYTGGESSRRYYQDAAIRAVLEKIAQGGNRALILVEIQKLHQEIAAELAKMQS